MAPPPSFLSLSALRSHVVSVKRFPMLKGYLGDVYRSYAAWLKPHDMQLLAHISGKQSCGTKPLHPTFFAFILWSPSASSHVSWHPFCCYCFLVVITFLYFAPLSRFPITSSKPRPQPEWPNHMTVSVPTRVRVPVKTITNAILESGSWLSSGNTHTQGNVHTYARTYRERDPTSENPH